MDFGTEKILPLRKSDANFQGIRSRVILAVTRHRAHLAHNAPVRLWPARSGVVCPGRAVILRARNRVRLPRAAPGTRGRDQTEI